MNLQRLGLHPLAVLPVQSLLRDLADVDLGVEVSGEGLVVVACVAVDDVEVLNLLEMVLGSVCREDTRHARVEAAAEDSRQSGLLEALAVGPLPAVFEVCLVLRLVVGRVEVVAARLQAGLHDGEVLIGQGQVHHDVGLVAAEQLHELRHLVGIYLCRLNPFEASGALHGGGQAVAFSFRARCNHDVGEDIGVLRNLMSGNGGHASGADNQYFSHCRYGFTVKSNICISRAKLAINLQRPLLFR